jgi:hypothetical protein
LRVAPAAFVLLLTLWLTGLACSQTLPDKIDGYQVHRAKVQVSVATPKDASGSDANIVVSEPRILELGMTGVKFELTAEVVGTSISGDVDRITFKDLSVNGLAIEAEDYSEPFKLRKGETVRPPRPFRGSVNTTTLVRAAFREMSSPDAEWRVTGTVFVFGRFKKMGFTFKRVIPVPVDVVIRNPLAGT